MPARARSLALAAVAASLAGCGGATTPLSQLRLQLTAPADGTRVTSNSIVVAGSVSPSAAASVLVLGQSVAMTHGTFAARVPLQPGTNIIDVLAGAPHHTDTMAAVRVYRQVLVMVPDVSGDSPAAAARAMRTAGLVARVQDNGQFFDFLLPGSPQVCSTAPPAGRSVAPGAVVTLSVSKSC